QVNVNHPACAPARNSCETTPGIVARTRQLAPRESTNDRMAMGAAHVNRQSSLFAPALDQFDVGRTSAHLFRGGILPVPGGRPRSQTAAKSGYLSRCAQCQSGDYTEVLQTSNEDSSDRKFVDSGPCHTTLARLMRTRCFDSRVVDDCTRSLDNDLERALP